MNKLAKLAKISVVLIVLALTPACMTTGSEGTRPAMTRSIYCEIAEPIRWSREDTVDTVRQVKEHNRSYKEICLGTE